MENDIAIEIKKSVKRIIKENDGKEELIEDSLNLKKLRDIVKKKDDCVSLVVFKLLQDLKKSGPEERKSIFLVIHYFFTRSNLFRQLIVDNIQDILLYVCEIDPQHFPIPGPTVHVRSLKTMGIKVIKEWHEKFSCLYVKLNSVVNFLKSSQALGFEQNSAEMHAERVRREEAERKKTAHAEKVMESIRVKWNRSKEDSARAITELDTALRILIPFMGETPDDVATPSIVGVSSQLHAIGSETISVTLKSVHPVVKVTDENDSIVESVLDGKSIANALKKCLEKYLQKLSGLGPTTGPMVKEILDTKMKLDQILMKVEDVKFEGNVRKRKQTEDDGSEDEWEDVPEKELEDFVHPIDDKVPKYVLDLIEEKERRRNEDEPCCSKFMDSPTESPSKSTPKIPFGLDLKYWGVERKDVEVPKNNSDCHRFWRPPDEDTLVAKEHEEVYSTRVFTFVGEPKIKSDRQCRVRLANDQLCPRRDFVRCPLHGLIIDRDEQGFPINAMEGETAKKEEKRFKEFLQKEEDEYNRDLEKQLGFKLGADKGRKKNINMSEGAMRRKRLEKKLLDPKAIKRISEVIDEARKKKIQKTFGHQFSHL